MQHCTMTFPYLSESQEKGEIDIMKRLEQDPHSWKYCLYLGYVGRTLNLEIFNKNVELNY